MTEYICTSCELVYIGDRCPHCKDKPNHLTSRQIEAKTAEYYFWRRYNSDVKLHVLRLVK